MQHISSSSSSYSGGGKMYEVKKKNVNIQT